MDNAGFAVFRLQQRVQAAHYQGATCGQGKQCPDGEGFEIFTAVAHAPQAGQLRNRHFEPHYHQSRGDSAHQAQ